MAPRHETVSPPASRRLLPCIPESWPLLTLCAAACALVGLILFIVGIIGVVQPSSQAKVRDWLFLSFGVVMLALGLSLLLLCRMRNASSARRARRNGRARTRPSRRDPLPVWTVDAIDPSFRPPPTYYEALHCAPASPAGPAAPVAPAPPLGPPPYTPASSSQPRMTDV